MTDELDANDPRPEIEPAREPYRRPVLVPLGSIRDLTLHTSGSRNPDGGSGRGTSRTARGGRCDAFGRLA